MSQPRTGLQAYWVPESPLWWIGVALGAVGGFLALVGIWGL